MSKVYFVEGESSDGNYLEGNKYYTEQEALQEVFALRCEFPNNEYWIQEEFE